MLAFSPSDYEMAMTYDPATPTVAQALTTLDMKFILEENYIMATDFLKLSVPPQNKEYEGVSG